MDEIRCKVEIREADGKPTRLIGTLLPFNVRARDRAEMFLPGSVSWPSDGVVLRRQHNRSEPILKFVPVEADGQLTVDALIPETRAGADALAEVKSGLLSGLSVEFKSIKEDVVGGVRKISDAVLVGAGLVDSPSYSQAVVEARELVARRASDRHTREFLL